MVRSNFFIGCFPRVDERCERLDWIEGFGTLFDIGLLVVCGTLFDIGFRFVRVARCFTMDYFLVLERCTLLGCYFAGRAGQCRVSIRMWRAVECWVSIELWRAK